MVPLRKEGLTQITIARNLGINQSNVSRAPRCYRDTGKFGARKRLGKHPCTNPRTDSMMRRLAVATPTIISTNIKFFFRNYAILLGATVYKFSVYMQ